MNNVSNGDIITNSDRTNRIDDDTGNALGHHTTLLDEEDAPYCGGDTSTECYWSCDKHNHHSTDANVSCLDSTNSKKHQNSTHQWV